MKRLYILMAALLALAFFAIPAMAASEDVTVTVTIETLEYMNYDGGTVAFVFDEWNDYGDQIVDKTDSLDIGANYTFDVDLAFTDGSGGEFAAGGWTLYVSADGGSNYYSDGQELYSDKGAGSYQDEDLKFKITGVDPGDGDTDCADAKMTFTISS